MSAVPVTIVIPTLEEAAQIAECVRSCAWADEVIVADGGSTDATVSLARAAGATVLEGTGPTIAAQRNAAIAVARNAWVFALDADERCTDPLIASIAREVLSPRHQAYRVWRRNFYLGVERAHGAWGRDRVVRLFPRERRYEERRVHEGLEPMADIGDLTGRLLHTPYRDLGHQVEKLRKYARWSALDMHDRGRRASWSDLTLRPAFRFLRDVVVWGQWRDGRAGIVGAGLDAWGGFMKYAELWALERAQLAPPAAPGVGP
ncbi:MAG: glycosyltransferase family 2 protein [Gemmatimonadales bacterium]